jgi:hypothetical protein
MYRINEWRERYEVSIKGREPKDGEELRAGPLSYIRLKVFGHRQGTGMRRLAQICGKDRVMEVFGIFCKFLEISGNQERDLRGNLLNERDEPATIEDLAFILDIPQGQIEFALCALSDAGWITADELSPQTPLNTTKHNSTQLKGTEISGNFRKSTQTTNSFTLKEIKDVAFTIGVPDDKAEAFYHHYNGQGWVFGNGLPIADLSSALVKWRNNQYRFEGKNGEGKASGKTKLFPIAGKTCCKCSLPAIYRDDKGEYPHHYCGNHMPEKVKEKYTW